MVQIHNFGHSFVQLKFKKTNVLIDPYINHKPDNDNITRIIPPAIKQNKLPKTDLILVSHEHFDHFDKKLIEFLVKRDDTKVLTTDFILNDLEIPKNNKIPVQLSDKINFKDITIEAIPAHHPQSFYPLSFLVKGDEKRIFHAGDTSLTDTFDDIKAHLALFPIGGYETMDLVDAVKATKNMKPEYAIPIHYNTFEFIKADPREFVYKINKSILKTKPIILEPGKKFNLK